MKANRQMIIFVAMVWHASHLCLEWNWQDKLSRCKTIDGWYERDFAFSSGILDRVNNTKLWERKRES
jgi:hypothetical protein